MIEISRPVVALLKALTRVSPLEDEEISGLHGKVLDELPARISDLILTHAGLTVETVAAVALVCRLFRPRPLPIPELDDPGIKREGASALGASRPFGFSSLITTPPARPLAFV
jgi:hypothetical protein